ncbi:MAG: L,D-transpeptidase [Chloroflexi bacterium]|nr:L,D-transpeptidase [Chloroflexota bacterium]
MSRKLVMRRLSLVAIPIAFMWVWLLAPALTTRAYAATEVPDRVYFSETGHTLSSRFLNYWHHTGRLAVFGFPISEERQEDGLTVQYFERARFEYHPENPERYQVLLSQLGRATGRATPAVLPGTPTAEAADWTYFVETGHNLAYGFKEYWEKNGGLPNFGYPISEESRENGVTIQYFERARFEYHPENPKPYDVLLSHLGRAAASSRGVDTAPVPRDPSIPVYSSSLWLKVIEVNLTTQSLVAYEGDAPVFKTLISSGNPWTPTPVGTFSIFAKYPAQDMAGPGYYLPAVPWVMWFAGGGYTLHGTYWHNNFGHPMSHGCVNLSIPDAEWLYSWTPMGTTVVVHY